MCLCFPAEFEVSGWVSWVRIGAMTGVAEMVRLIAGVYNDQTSRSRDSFLDPRLKNEKLGSGFQQYNIFR